MRTKKLLMSKNQPLLTRALIDSTKAAIEADQRQLEQIQERIAKNKRWLEAAMFIAPEEFDPSKEPTNVKGSVVKKPAINSVRRVTRTRKSTKLTWISEVSRILNTSERGISHQEVLGEIMKGKLSAKSSPEHKGFYAAVAKLNKRGDIVKIGGLIYSAKLAKELERRGQFPVDRVDKVLRRTGSGGSLIVDVLKTHADGLTAPDLKKILSTLPDAPQSIRAHGQYIYNLLGTLIGNGTVAKENGIYRLVQLDNGVRH